MIQDNAAPINRVKGTLSLPAGQMLRDLRAPTPLQALGKLAQLGSADTVRK